MPSLPIVNHEDYFAKIGDDHKFPIKKFGELANYLIKNKIVNNFHKPYPYKPYQKPGSHEEMSKDSLCTKAPTSHTVPVHLRFTGSKASHLHQGSPDNVNQKKLSTAI